MKPMHDAWIGDSEDFTIIDVRFRTSDDRTTCHNFFSVKTSDQHSAFFTRLKNLDKIEGKEI